MHLCVCTVYACVLDTRGLGVGEYIDEGRRGGSRVGARTCTLTYPTPLSFHLHTEKKKQTETVDATQPPTWATLLLPTHSPPDSRRGNNLQSPCRTPKPALNSVRSSHTYIFTSFLFFFFFFPLIFFFFLPPFNVK